MNLGGQPNNEIWYTTTDGVAVTLGSQDFGANILTHTYEDGYGVITFDSAVTHIGEFAFRGSTLESINLPSRVTEIGYGAFWDCTSLPSITIPDSVTEIGDYAFYYCSSLTSVTIGNGVTSIGQEAFEYCSSLTSVTIGNSVNKIGFRAFGSCDSLTSVYINDLASWCSIQFYDTMANPLHKGVSLYINGDIVYDELAIPDNITRISDYAFYGLGATLSSLTIPSNITDIGAYAFGDCEIYYLNIEEGFYRQIGDYAFGSGIRASVYLYGAPTMSVGTDIFGSNYADVSIYVPGEYLEEYQALLPQYNITGE